MSSICRYSEFCNVLSKFSYSQREGHSGDIAVMLEVKSSCKILDSHEGILPLCAYVDNSNESHLAYCVLA